MTDDTRRLLETYCPELHGIYLFRGQLSDELVDKLGLHAVFSAMVRKGEWEAFCEYAFDYETEGLSPHNVKANQDGLFYDTKFTAWLFCLSDPSQIGERMAMAAEFLKMEGLWAKKILPE